MPPLLRGLAHGRYGIWDEVLFLAPAAIIFGIILFNGWRAGRAEPDESAEDELNSLDHDEHI